MAPNATFAPTGILFPEDKVDNTKAKKVEVEVELPYLWSGLVFYGICHLCAAYGLYLAIFGNMKLLSWIYSIFILALPSALSVTVGAHRLWSHRAFKAKLPLRILLAVFFSISLQESILDWCRHHRVHHKNSDTDGDPLNINRGFWFSHMGWLMRHRHPLVIESEKKVDFSDVESDPVVAFQHKYILPILGLSMLIPTFIPVLFWGESLANACFACVGLRSMIVLHATLFINSGGHRWGDQPYQKDIAPKDNFYLSLLAFGEGWHNYHHAFPWDYRNRELPGFYGTSAFIDLMAKIGWAYDLKTTTPEMIRSRVKRTGDGSHVMASVWAQQDSDAGLKISGQMT